MSTSLFGETVLKLINLLEFKRGNLNYPKGAEKAEHLSKTHDFKSLKCSLMWEVKALSLKSMCGYSIPFLFSLLKRTIFFRAPFFQ